jgi:hypothetical protein
MIWFRSKLRSCAGLALFALVVQIAVSFGHVHEDDLGLSPAVKAGQAKVALGASVVPDRQDRYPGSDDYCPVCASIALASTGLTSLPPVIAVPVSVSQVSFVLAAPESVPTAVSHSFRARAPPFS